MDVRSVLTKHWKLGTLTFLCVLALCAVAMWQRQVRYNLVFTFSVPTIAHRIQLPSLSAVYPESIMHLLRLSLQEHSVRAAIIHHNGTFALTLDSIAAGSTDGAQQVLSTIYQQLTDQLSKDIDPTPLSAQLTSLNAQLDLIAKTLRSTNLSDYEQYALNDRALMIGTQRTEARNHLEIVSKSLFSQPNIQLYRAMQMGNAALLVLSVILGGFVACATMILAASLHSNTELD